MTAPAGPDAQPRPARRNDIDDGSITVVAAVLIAGMLALVAVLAGVGVAAIARHRAAAAADFAALAGAVTARSGQQVACARASAVAAAGGAELDSCELAGLDVRVQVSMPAGVFGLQATARAHAGPAP